MERTFAIVKPDAFAAGHAGRILARIYEEGFCIVGMKKLNLSEEQAAGFYYVHKDRPFFDDLKGFMSSGPCLALMGATNPADARTGTLRKEFGTSLGRNAVHGSDAPETAAFEMGYFFSGMELL